MNSTHADAIYVQPEFDTLLASELSHFPSNSHTCLQTPPKPTRTTDENVLASSIVEVENSLLTNAFTHSGATVVLPPQGTKRKAQPSCPTCGGTDHQRCSSKKCPQYKPRLKSRKVKKQDVALDDIPERKTICTVNIGLNTLLVAQQLRDVIIDAVARCTDIYSEASRFLNGYVIWRLEQGQNIPDLRYSSQDGRMRQFFQAVLSTGNNDPLVRKTVNEPSINQYALLYSANRPATLAWNDTSLISCLVSSMANLYATNCQNHVVTNMERWISRLVKYKLEKHLAFLLNGDETEALRDYMMAKIRDPNSNTIQFPGRVMNRFPGDDDSKALVMAGVDHILRKVRQKIDSKALDEESLKSAWWTYIPLMRRILKTFAKNQRDHQYTRRPGRGLRLFSLVPISSLRQKHILIETTALFYLFRAANYPNLCSLEEFKDDHLDWWRRAFNIDLVTTQRREFGCSITTDGIQACVHLQKPRVQPPQLNDWGYRYDSQGIYEPLDIEDGTRIVGLDPGRGSLYVAVSGDNQADVLKCSNGRWQEISGTRYSAQKNKTWMKNDPQIRAWITLMPTPCCYTSDAYNQHLLHFLGMRDLLLGFYRDIKWRRLRWKTRIKRQKAYDTICNELTGGHSDTVIAYGGGRFHHASRGHAPTPNKHLFTELKRRCRPRLTSEYRTSVVCSICQHDLAQSRFWQVKNCGNCLTIWNRDVNAARNIRFCFMFKNEYGDRPEPFLYVQHA